MSKKTKEFRHHKLRADEAETLRALLSSAGQTANPCVILDDERGHVIGVLLGRSTFNLLVKAHELFENPNYLTSLSSANEEEEEGFQTFSEIFE